MTRITRHLSSTPDARWTEQPAGSAAAGEAALALTGARHQTWEGFGGCFNELGWIALAGLDDTARQQVIAALFDPQGGCRFSHARLPIGASDYAAEWYSHNEHDGDFAMAHFAIDRDRRYLIPYIKMALALRPDLTLFASPWSPPTWLKCPKVYNYGTLIWEPRYLAAYADYFVKFVQAYAAEGITIRQIHPQNEPVADQKFPSCRWTGAQLRAFIRDYLGPRLRAAAPGCEVWLGTLNTDDYDTFILDVLQDAQARAYLAGVGFQWAGKHAIQRTAMSWPQLRLMQTENECGDGQNSWAYAHYVFTLLHHYISNGASAYLYWNMVLPPGGRSTWGWPQNAMVTVDPAAQTVVYNPEFYVMQHFAHCVAPGAVRVGLSGAWSGNAVAFANPDGATVVVAANPFDAPKTLTIAGAGTVTMPASSFNTVVLG